uniref:Transposase (Putative), gypsy type n=1 Tax=Tanacetum cinerariifolium TaxID=118510 RepID=A0A6L2JX55_TANCI|nr:hypothetical protein [Tanacetum cinerariifolium]
MGRDIVQLETAVNTISQEYLLEFTSEYGIPETLHPELPGLKDRIVDFSEGKVGGGCHTAKGRGRILPNVTPSHWTLSKTGTTASFGSTRECSRPSWTGRRMPPKTGCQLRAREDWKPPTRPHEVPLLTLTATRVIEMDDPAAATDSSGVPSTIERSLLDFSHEAGASDQGTVSPEMPPSEDVPATDVPEAGQAEGTAATDPPTAPESRKRGRDKTDVNAPPKSLRRDNADPRPSRSSHGGKKSCCHTTGFGLMLPSTAAVGDPESKNASSPVEVGSPESIYRPKWGVANGSLLDTPEACQDLVDHVAPPGYFSELRHIHNEEFLRQYNVNLAQQVEMRSQLRLRFEQEAKLLRKSVAQVARRDKRIQARELEIKNLEARLETKADMKKAAKDKNAGLIQELEDIRARFSDLQRCAELDARLDALSIDFDEELYPHMLTAIAGRRWVIGHGLRLALMKCGESLEMKQAFVDVVSAGIAKGMSEGLRHGALKDLKYSLVDQLKGLKDAPMDVIMASLYLESDTGGDASQYIRDLRPSSSQHTIPVYPESFVCSMRVFTISQRLGYIIKDTESAAARVATHLCGGPCTKIHGS